MDAIGNKHNNTLGQAIPRVDHGVRMDRVEKDLQDQSVAVSQLNPQQTSDFRGYAGTTLENIGRVFGFGPVGDVAGTGDSGSGQVGIIGLGPSTPEQREKDLEDKIREKTDPEFAAKKKAEKTARELNSLLNPSVLLLGGFGPGFGGGGMGGNLEQAQRDNARHEGDLKIIDILYELKGDEMSAVKTEYEKTFGKELEDDIRTHFRGDVQQKLLGLVRGGGEAGAQGEGKGEAGGNEAGGKKDGHEGHDHGAAKKGAGEA